jgi:uncharacterized Fe-S radical SAM superfamily protein PflX
MDILPRTVGKKSESSENIKKNEKKDDKKDDKAIGATAPVLNVKYHQDNTRYYINFVTGKPLRLIEYIPEVLYYVVYNYMTNTMNLQNTVYEINTLLRWSTDIQISDLEFLEMIERLNKDSEYFTNLIETVLNKIDYIV